MTPEQTMVWAQRRRALATVLLAALAFVLGGALMAFDGRPWWVQTAAICVFALCAGLLFARVWYWGVMYGSADAFSVLRMVHAREVACPACGEPVSASELDGLGPALALHLENYCAAKR